VSRKTSSKSRFAAFVLAAAASSAAVSSAAVLSVAATTVLVGCGPALSGGEGADWPELQKKWYDRAAASFAELDVPDAESAIQNALRVEPEQEQVRLLAANIALSQLRYDEAIRHLQGLASRKASGLRARALWYSGQVTGAAEELGRLLADPEVKDPWAEGV
jgi:predicted Zn-dependent protease